MEERVSEDPYAVMVVKEFFRYNGERFGVTGAEVVQASGDLLVWLGENGYRLVPAGEAG